MERFKDAWDCAVQLGKEAERMNALCQSINAKGYGISDDLAATYESLFLDEIREVQILVLEMTKAVAGDENVEENTDAADSESTENGGSESETAAGSEKGEGSKEELNATET